MLIYCRPHKGLAVGTDQSFFYALQHSHTPHIGAHWHNTSAHTSFMHANFAHFHLCVQASQTARSGCRSVRHIRRRQLTHRRYGPCARLRRTAACAITIQTRFATIASGWKRRDRGGGFRSAVVAAREARVAFASPTTLDSPAWNGPITNRHSAWSCG